MKFDHRFVLKTATASTRVYAADGVTARLDFLEHMLRVAVLHDEIPLLPTWSVCPGGGDCPLEGRDKLSLEGFRCLAPAVREAEGALSFSIDGVDFSVSHLKVHFVKSGYVDKPLCDVFHFQ